MVFVFGLVTFTFAAGDEVGRRLAAVQLVDDEDRDRGGGGGGVRCQQRDVVAVAPRLPAAGVAGLVPDAAGPKGPTS